MLRRRSNKISIKRRSIKRSSNKRSIKKRSNKRRTIKRSIKKRSIKRKKKIYDGMDNPIDSISSTKKIKVENYIDDIELFYNKSFIDTICFFKIFKTNKKENDTFDFIKELFNFSRGNINTIYHNKTNILGSIINSGLYDDFEKLIDEIKIKETDGDILNCSKRQSPYFTQQHKGKRNKKVHIKTKINYFIGDIDISRFLEINIIKEDEGKEDEEKEKKEFEIKKFIYYSICIDSQIRKYIMRHYLLHFIKSRAFFKYKDKLLNTSANETNKKIINNFLMTIDKYELIPYGNVNITKNDKKKYSFSSCGETTLLNLLNYYFINYEGKFNIPGDVSDELKNFYVLYNTMENQLKNIDDTIKDWCEMVVSNLKKSHIEETEVNLYNYEGDIHNNIKNIIFVLKTILKSNGNDVKNILTNISKKEDEDEDEDENKIVIVFIDENTIEFKIDKKYTVRFEPGHGAIYLNKKKKKILF